MRLRVTEEWKVQLKCADADITGVNSSNYSPYAYFHGSVAVNACLQCLHWWWEGWLAGAYGCRAVTDADADRMRTDTLKLYTRGQYVKCMAAQKAWSEQALSLASVSFRAFAQDNCKPSDRSTAQMTIFSSLSEQGKAECCQKTGLLIMHRDVFQIACPPMHLTDSAELAVEHWINKERPACGFITPNAALHCVCRVKVKAVAGKPRFQSCALFLVDWLSVCNLKSLLPGNFRILHPKGP